MPAVIQDRTSYFLRRPARPHPYAGVHHDPRGHYHDFKARPDLIETVLEDFVPHTACAGVAAFFALLHYINRPDGPFETTDCGLCQYLYQSRNSPFPDKAGWVGGRVMLMWRRLERNYPPSAATRLCRRFRRALEHAGKAFTHIGFVVGPFPTLFTASGRKGFQVDVEFAMWGDSLEDGMRRLDDVVAVLEKAVRRCEDCR